VKPPANTHDPSARDRNRLRCALHTHTTRSDGELAPGKLLRVYRDLGFDVVALTDHDFLMTPNVYDGVPDEFEGMLVLKGVEKTVFAKGYMHVNVIRGDTETLHVFNHPAEFGLTVEQVVERIREIEQTMSIHAVEVTAKGYYTPEYDTDAIPYPKIATDDVHALTGCGRGWVEVACEKDPDAVLQAVKAGRARVCYNSTARVSTWGSRR
jgi:hypothetical protein